MLRHLRRAAALHTPLAQACTGSWGFLAYSPDDPEDNGTLFSGRDRAEMRGIRRKLIVRLANRFASETQPTMAAIWPR